MARQEWRMLPNRTATKSVKKYLKEWHAIMDPICKLMGWTVYGFDPAITFREANGGAVEIPVEFVQRICDLIAACKMVYQDCVKNPCGNFNPIPTDETMIAIRKAISARRLPAPAKLLLLPVPTEEGNF